MCGIIVQQGKVVGAICIPDGTNEFIEEFNNCYGPLRMQVSEVEPHQRREGVVPTFRFRLPTWYREAWRPKVDLHKSWPSNPPSEK